MSHGVIRDCYGTQERPHRFVLFDLGDGPCPICQTLDALYELRTGAIERHANIAPYRPMMTEEDIAFQREPSLASWAKATVARYRQHHEQAQLVRRLRAARSEQEKITAGAWFIAVLRSVVRRRRTKGEK